MKISDSHNDFLTSIDSFVDREKYINEIQSFGVKTISCAVFTTHNPINIEDVIKYNLELEYLNKKYDINLILSIEDLGFIKTRQELVDLINLRPFSTTLTWNDCNQFSGGANSLTGLSRLGKTYINILEQNKVLIDTAHLSRHSFWDFCKQTSLPIYNSHSNIYNIHYHNRNLTNTQISQIVNSNGYLGITLYDKFVSYNKISSKDIATQFDYLIQKFGYKNFGLGSDFYGIDNKNLPIDIQNYINLSNIVEELKNLGYNNDIIEHLLYKNFENFMQSVNKI